MKCMPNASVVHCVSLQGSEATASRQNFKQESVAIKDEPNQQPISHYPTHPRAVLSQSSMTELPVLLCASSQDPEDMWQMQLLFLPSHHL